MKKLLVLLSSSIFFSLTTLSIYVLNSKNNVNQLSNFVLKQKEQKEETDLSKIFDNYSYISIKNKDDNVKEKVLQALKLKYKNLDFSLLDIDVEVKNTGGIDVKIAPKKDTNKYTKSVKIPCYIKTNLALILKENNDLGEIPINNVDEILKHIKNKDLLKTSFKSTDFYITNIREDSVKISATITGDFYEEGYLKFKAKKKILSSAIYKPNLELEKVEKDNVIKVLKDTYPSLKNENLDIDINHQKKKITVKTISSSQFVGTVFLNFDLVKQKQNQQVDSKNIDTNSTIKNPNTSSNSLDLKKELDKNLSNNKIEKPNPSVLNKNNNSPTKNTILTIPNKNTNKSNKNSKTSGEIVGIAIGSTLGIGSIIGGGVASYLLYFKKRK
ncbi:hypothetical protein [Mycoplasma capricolum]|uniref:Membrane protein, putative n=1 Tax=Mycoplasma capricolum subsp. capricolum (strain California kid / ATCC 27343 / NCTC 10154) TaxID=340047 RepID=Q2SS85_MYCCT|nr:hypothetical protein [Mycoplasma capricolum]ABC01794.1 membrane protein, putative [Mycoplasma capricolum subsp. capricolum ATCC 27343]